MDFNQARRAMVSNQLRPSGVVDEAVLSAMAAIPRETFVPKSLRSVAYLADDIVLGGGRVLMAPLVAGLLIQTAAIGPSDIVLEIGAGGGYGAAVLSRLCNTVVALESDALLADQASRAMTGLAIDNVAVVTGPLRMGYRAQAPFDAIILAGAVDRVPEELLGQLADGGRLVALVAGPAGMGRGTLFTRKGGAIGRREVFDAATARLAEFENPKGFVFA
jgi:protein-L-isoaspartate(D-aspartate) O-methyltransferase